MSDRALLAAREAAAAWLWERRRLRLKRPDAPVLPTTRPLTFLGHRLTRGGATPTRAALRRMERRVGGLVASGDVEAIERSLAGFAGVLRLRSKT